MIAGAMNAEQVKANAAASEWVPSAAELAEIDKIVPPPAACWHSQREDNAAQPPVMTVWYSVATFFSNMAE